MSIRIVIPFLVSKHSKLMGAAPICSHARYVYDLRWVEGWGSIYGATAVSATRFVQLWATVPQHPATMAHLLQQGAVMSSGFQPFEAARFFFCCVKRCWRC